MEGCTKHREETYYAQLKIQVSGGGSPVDNSGRGNDTASKRDAVKG
jgi:hypothetical protein